MDNNPEEVRLSAPGAKVFGNPLLREMILEYAINERRNSKRVQAIRFCRLVNKTWLRSISTILFQSQRPLFQLYLCKYSKAKRRDAQEKENLLDQFLRCVVTGPLCSEERVPPFSIETSYRYFDEENCQALVDFLKSHGNGLVELDLSISCGQRPKPLIPTTSTSRLRSFSVHIDKHIPNETIEFFQSVFDASERLQSFELNSWCSTEFRSLALNNLLLPQSLTIVYLECQVNHLDVLVNSCLPNLKKLSLSVLDKRVHLKDGLFSSIFRNIGKTLEYFILRGGEDSELVTGSPTFKLPLMEKLKLLSIQCFFLEVDNKNLQEFIPAVTGITLTNQTSTMFYKWTDRSCFDSVTSLTVSWNEKEARNEDLAENFMLRQMEALHAAFPNLERLNITINKVEDFPSVGVIWREKRKLKYLDIHVRDDCGVGNTHEWDALLIGLPENQVKELRESPGLWEELKLASTTSIRNLTDLKDLRLTTIRGSRFPLISDAAFHFAFLLMPNLKRVYLEGSFFTTKEMQKHCEEHGLDVEMYGDRNYGVMEAD